MKKTQLFNLTIIALLFFQSNLFAQDSVIVRSDTESVSRGGWKKVNDKTNPVTTIRTQGRYKGVAWVDYDNDGYSDLFVAPDKLFRNLGNKNFAEVTATFGAKNQQGASGTSWADVNNDGNIDCMLSQLPSGIFLGDGHGNFTDVTSQVPFLSEYASWGCAFGNLNNDEKPEFMLVHAANFHPGPVHTNRLYIQKPKDFIPQIITGHAFTNTTGPYTVPFFSDYDQDGDMDLFVASGPAGTPGPDYCYNNMKKETGKDTIVRITSEKFTKDLQDGQCYNFIDYDNDGDFDLCLSNYFGAYTRFYVNNNGIYDTLATPFSFKRAYLANCWGDYDNDGDLDVIFTNDYRYCDYFENNGNGNFTYLPDGFTTPIATSGIANCDYDNDGDLDIFTNGQGFQAMALYENENVAKKRNWINFMLEGVESNHSALGTLVKIKSVINGKATWQTREVNAQNSFMSQNDLRVHFGLNTSTIVDSVIIRWPSGNVQVFKNIPAGHFYKVKEGKPIDNITKNNNTESNMPVEKKTKPDLRIIPNPAKNSIAVILDNALAQTSTFDVTNATGKNFLQGNFQGGRADINIQKLQPGAYFISIYNGSTFYSGSFLKQ